MLFPQKQVRAHTYLGFDRHILVKQLFRDLHHLARIERSHEGQEYRFAGLEANVQARHTYLVLMVGLLKRARPWRIVEGPRSKDI